MLEQIYNFVQSLSVRFITRNPSKCVDAQAMSYLNDINMQITGYVFVSNRQEISLDAVITMHAFVNWIRIEERSDQHSLACLQREVSK